MRLPLFQSVEMIKVNKNSIIACPTEESRTRIIEDYQVPEYAQCRVVVIKNEPLDGPTTFVIFDEA